MKNSRRTFVKLFGTSIGAALLPLSHVSTANEDSKKEVVSPVAGLNAPKGVYINWAAYDELSDNIKLDESLAMKQIQELIRLKKLGVQLDYYIMDAFWFEKNTGYRTWRKKDWPNGPEPGLMNVRKMGSFPDCGFLPIR